MLPNFAFTAFAVETTIVYADLTSGLYKEITDEGEKSVWGPSGKTGPNGKASRYTSSANDSASYSAAQLSAGTYGVYFYVRPLVDRDADKIDVTIAASGMQTTVTVNGHYGTNDKVSKIYLGKYTFTQSALEGVTQKINPNSYGVMRAFAVEFVKNDTNSAQVEGEVTQLVISNTASSANFEKSGTWSASGLSGAIGEKAIFSADASAKATFKANAFNGSYGVYLYMNPPSNATDYIDAHITASGNTSTTKLDAKNAGKTNEWVFLGVHTFNGNYNDKLVIQKNPNADGGNIHVFSAKFIKNDTNTSRPSNIPIASKITLKDNEPVLLDTNDFGFLLEGVWSESSVVLTGSQSYHTAVNGASAMWLIDVGDTDGVEVFVPKLSNKTSTNEDAGTVFEVCASGVKKRTVIDFTGEGVGWKSLGKYNFSGDGTEYVKIIKDTSNGKGVARVIAIKISLNEVVKEDVESILKKDEDLYIFERMGMYIPSKVSDAYMIKNITRADMAVMLTRLFGKHDDVINEITKATGPVSHFNDTVGHAYQNTLAWIKLHPEFGLKKQGSNSYSPDSYATETELIRFILHQLGYYEDVDYSAKDTKTFAESLGIDTSYNEYLTPTSMARILASAFDVATKNKADYSFFEKMVRENSGIEDPDLLERIPFSEEMKKLRASEDYKWKDRNVIYNNDGNDVYKTYPAYPGDYTPKPTEISNLKNNNGQKAVSNFLAARTTGIENSVVNTVYYCTGVVNSYTHITLDEEKEKGIDTRQRDWSYLLEDYTGKDTLDIMIEAVKGVQERDMDIFWSMRMNDTHDYKYEFKYLDSWKRANPDNLFTSRENALYMLYGDRRWSSIDYTYQESRQKIYNILKDTLENYDVDGLELDFTRHPLYFSEVAWGEKTYRENIERMNDFMRMVRALTEQYSMERGKPILVSVYLPDCLDMCYDLGLDVRKWMDEDLFDIASICCYMGSFHPWEESIGEFEGKVPVYAALDNLCYSNSGLEEMDDYEIDRYEAALAYKAGAAGVYTYNRYDINHERFDTLYDFASCGVTEAELAKYQSRRKPYSGNYCVDSEKYVTLNK